MKRAAGVEDCGTSNTSKDRDRGTTSLEGEPERHTSVSADGAKHKTGYNSRWEADHTWVFYVEGKGMYCMLC